jgi:hypothetical protein
VNRAADRPRFQFSLRDLACLVVVISAWLAVVHYWGPLGIIFTSPLLGAGLLLVGIIYRLWMLAVLGVVLFLAGPMLLGITFALVHG